ncbi:MAG: hypothetical protein HZB23_10250 [Deltaproteobacteria bacterium]|nr:hypothetical protein [Deltaproteobacteria bacterium]
MSVIFNAAALAQIMKRLACPHCGHWQDRTRSILAHGRVTCHKCKKTFAVAEGRKAGEAKTQLRKRH